MNELSVQEFRASALRHQMLVNERAGLDDEFELLAAIANIDKRCVERMLRERVLGASS